jgi:hypothetical protein
MILNIPERHITINTEAIDDADRKRYAEIVELATSVDGMRLYAEMLSRKVPMNIMRDVYIVARKAEIVDLDWVTARNELGHWHRHPRQIEDRKTLYTRLYDLRLGTRRKYSLPEIAAAFGTAHTSVLHSIRYVASTPRVKLVQKVQP